ncbi:DsbA family protein, partial [Candidatus Parcubacteria bacterium]|nr:DsbA family protein [Candidatus Parcubacteria bacterium]
MEQEHSSKFLVPGAIVVAGLLVAGAIYAGGGTAPSYNTGQVSRAVELPSITSKDHILGSASADVVIVEYSDTECPFCKAFHNTLKQVMSTYGGKVAWVYRHFPIAQLHSKAPNEAEATE